jgi:hypothetical protein
VKVEVYRESKHEAEGIALRKRIEAWAEKAKRCLSGDPSMPEAITNGRFADKWEPIFCVADIIDGMARTENRSGTDRTPRTGGADVTGRVGGTLRRAALEYLKDEKEDTKPDFGELVLKDLSDIFNEDPSRKFYPTSELLKALEQIPEAPWSCFHNNNRPLSDRGLSSLLKPFKIKSKQQASKEKHRGYYRADFDDAFSRHLCDYPSVFAVLSAPAVPAIPKVALTPVGGISGLQAVRFTE